MSWWNYAEAVFVHGKMQCFSLKEPIWLHLWGFVVGGQWVKKSAVRHILCYMLSQYHILIFSVSPRTPAMKSDYILRIQASLENK